ncbi:MAG: phosphate signaling complex protein PhoU [Casimicrobiaceae bacterium]|nr:phosphate signaling complex protein PhoU [Casimicrobiaceae bacterium]
MEHSSKQYEQELEELRGNVLAMGGLVEAQLTRAIEAIETGDAELIAAVVREEKKVNVMQVEADRLALSIIAKRQPAAIDLRQIVCSIQATTDLERIGDEIKRVATLAQQFQTAERLAALRLNEVRHLADLAREMLKDTLDAFARLDVVAAGEVIGRDAAVDDEYTRIMRLLVSYMSEDPRTISAGIDVAFAAKALERVADHSKNIAEYVIYIVQGNDPRHSSKPEA